MNLPAFVRRYVGVPWLDYGRDLSGSDCWGMVRIVYAEQLSIELPAYSTGYSGTRKEDAPRIAQLMTAGKDDWVEVARRPPTLMRELCPIGQARPFDVLLIRQWGVPCHVGLVVAPGAMLHIEEGVDSCVEEYDAPRWLPRIEGIYRWPR